MRIDSEFYQKKYVISNSVISNIRHTTLGEIIDELTDYHANGSYKVLKKNVELLDEKNYAHMVRTCDFVKDDFKNDIKYIDRHAYEFLTKTQLLGGEILVNKIGSKAGQSFLMPEIKKPTSLGMNIFLLRLKEEYSTILYYAYLNSLHGINLINQKINGAAPRSIDKDSLREVLVPLFSSRIEKIVELIYRKGVFCKKESIDLYEVAEKKFMEVLGFALNKVSHKSYNCKYYQESFLITKRLDAEYYHPKYDYIDEVICQCNSLKLGELVHIYKSIEPGSKEYQSAGTPFVRVSDLSNRVITEPSLYISDELANDYEIKMKCKYNDEFSIRPRKDTILLTKDGTIGKSYKVRKDSNFVTSSALVHLIIKDNQLILPDYLTLCLNSLITKLQSERDSGGSIIKHWRIDQIDNLIIPLVSDENQRILNDIVVKSNCFFELSSQYKNLAIDVIDKYIDSGEESSIRYGKEVLEKLEKKRKEMKNA